MCLTESIWAREIKGVSFPETITINEKTCKLMGVGIRKKFIINVYLGALYLSQPKHIASSVVSDDQIKRVVMHFLYKEVKARQLVDAWNEGFEKNTGKTSGALLEKIKIFNSFFTESFKKSEIIVLTYIPKRELKLSLRMM